MISCENYMVITPDRILLSQLYNWHNAEKNMHFYSCRPLHDIEDRDEWIKKMLDAQEQRKDFLHVLVHQNSPDCAIGRIKCFDYNPRNKSIEIGYYFPECNRKKGYGPIALMLMLKNMFDNTELQLNKIYATTSSNNIGSIKTLEKCGFIKEGECREHYWIDGQKFGQCIYSILRKEWKNLN